MRVRNESEKVKGVSETNGKMSFQDIQIHPLTTSIEPPERMNNPFCYEPHPLCVIAADEVRAFIRGRSEWHEEVDRGKMFGVLVVRDGTRLGYLAAYSGQIGGRSDWEGFVPAVFDYLQEDGYFKRHEAEITEMNHEVEHRETSSELLALKNELERLRREADADIAEHRNRMTEAKRQRDHRRATETLSAEDEARMTAESQFLKAELHRAKRRYAELLSGVEAKIAGFRTAIDVLKRERKRYSDDLQRWLFSHFCMLNAEGESRNLMEIFADTVLRVPPAGAGECCEPKLLQYAFSRRLRPLCMAMFWVGESPKMEIRHDGCFYPACSGKCKPILTWMLRGIDVETVDGGDPSACGCASVCARSDRSEVSSASPFRFSSLETVYEDEVLVVVCKPSGMLSVPGKSARLSAYDIVKARCRDAEEIMAVHRLDMATSGLLVFAKTKAAHKSLQRQFAEHTIVKRYVAVLSAPIARAESVISLPMRPDPLDRPRQVVDMLGGKSAITRYRLISHPQTPVQRAFAKHGSPLVALYPETGRTHQLRVHCAHRDGLNAPIVGDTLYGTAADRLYLHAEYLEITHPVTGERMRFTSQDCVL